MRRLITRRARRLRKLGLAADLGDGARAKRSDPSRGTARRTRSTAAVKDVAALSRTAIDLHARIRAEHLRTSR